METRSLAIGLVAIVAAFAAAFGVAKSGGSKTETAGAGVKAQSIKVAAPAAVSGVEVGGTLPALKAERKAPAKKKKKPASSTNNSQAGTSDGSDTQAPSTNNSAPPTNNAAPPTNNSAPPSTSQPKPSTPKPNPTPVSGGGEDG